MILLLALALSIGFVAGLRALTAPAITSWAAFLGWLDATQSPLAFLGSLATALGLSVAAIVELVLDRHPRIPDRQVSVRFAGRVLAGAISGGAIGASDRHLLFGAACGAVGAAIGTFVGVAGRARVAAYFDNERTAAFLEDVTAIGVAFIVVVHVA